MSAEVRMKPIQVFAVKGVVRAWGTETIIGETADYMGKILRYNAGCAGGLQLHRTKDETFYLVTGTALIDSDDGTGALMTRHMDPGESFHIPAGAPHRFQATTDCVVFEVSTPVHDDRVRLEGHYGVPAIGGPGLVSPPLPPSVRAKAEQFRRMFVVVPETEADI